MNSSVEKKAKLYEVYEEGTVMFDVLFNKHSRSRLWQANTVTCVWRKDRGPKSIFSTIVVWDLPSLEVILFSTNSKLTCEKFIYQIHEFIDQRNELTVIKLMVGLYR